jgi:hypothetical protein
MADQIFHVPLTHEPLRPARDLVAEQVFAAEWLRLMTTPTDHDDADYDGPENGHQLSGILAHHPRLLNDRQSRVAASIIVWFGTNCGNCFLLEARQLRDRGVRYPFVAQWAIDNTRFSWLNSGMKLIEHCCATELNPHAYSFGRQMVCPDLTVEDYETVEHVMVWLGNDEGRAFVAECERKIMVRNEIKKLGLTSRSIEALGINP